MPRITVTGVAEIIDDRALKARYLAVHPYASLYADFGDFATWRVTPGGGLLVGGFARATRLKAAELTPDADAVAAILAAEPGVLAHCNRDHADALAAIAGIGWGLADGDGGCGRLRSGAGREGFAVPLVRAGERCRGCPQGTGADGAGRPRRVKSAR